MTRIDKGPEAGLRQHPGFARGYVAKKPANAPLMEVTCFNLPFDSQVCNLGNQASASTNGAA